MDRVTFDPAQLDSGETTRRRCRVVTLILVLTGPGLLIMADLHWRTGYDGWKVVHLCLFAALSVLVSLGAAQALVGFGLRRRGGDPCQIVNSLDPADDDRVILARTAVVMPICNEEVERVIEGLRAIYESLRRTGQLPECDFFLLSDSTDPNCWIAEEAAWFALAQRLGAQGRIFYRKRRVSINKKSGNLADFCRRWGKLYRYMVVLDADSMITGDAIVRLVRLMERNRHVGIIQGVPLLVNGETILGRLQQFASQLYLPVSAAGLNYWQLGEANYWGHNAIIRLAPFIRHCSLPELPKNGVFGGRILSHDFVEAALMRRAGWQVWLATELGGNYEECPATIIDFAKRDRRWLEGNLQHARLVVTRGFHWANRVHFMLGILTYLASPLWLAFLLVSVLIAANIAAAGLNLLPVPSFAAYAHWTYRGEAFFLFGYTAVLLLLPKALALLDLRSRPADLAGFGGWKRLWAGVFVETLVFTLLAPVLMLFHTWFIFLATAGKKVSWGAQRRGGGVNSTWTELIAAHGVQTALGILGSIAVFKLNASLALWMSPVFAGLVFSIPLSYITGNRSLGQTFRRCGILQTPEESRPSPELAQLALALASRHRSASPPPELAADYGLMQAVLDPYVNAVHASLLRTKDNHPAGSEDRFVAMHAKLLQKGPKGLTHRERIALLMDADSMGSLHHQIWSTPASQLAEWWRLALRHYTRLTPARKTAKVRLGGRTDAPFAGL